MAQVTVDINERSYQIACDDGQEAHLTRLGNYIDNRVQELIAAVGQVGDARLLVMVSLLIADELSDAYAELKVASSGDGASARLDREENLSVALEAIAHRIEDIAGSLDRA
ncbi:MAG: cell division protein ZapA [Rhodospirillaceae bacterium]|jgi:cell division protein ZapA|nr:cell division protein ZapA [Rhodospirillaceae bacterium]MBT5298813.1 cell division protein ZapA [Rhodospirillaceae bacterium]MBT5515072.1 cell division protein ZapA [Rhodospirillaceae bacterium]MBT6085605.1 cell division protein ZapA [Rhodospirillaceae bacterium]MBT7249481.1 cell division protein ZapA [Rhodospirillaceae bacterium]